MASVEPITKTYDPFPRITEYEKSKIPAEPSTPPKEVKQKDKSDILSSPIIAELILPFTHFQILN